MQSFTSVLHLLLHPAWYPKRLVPAPLLCSCHPLPTALPSAGLPPWHSWKIFLYSNSGESIEWKELKYPAFPRPTSCYHARAARTPLLAASATTGVRLLKPHTKYLITDIFSSISQPTVTQTLPTVAAAPGKSTSFICFFLLENRNT